jgi:WD40 repeat protein
VLNESGNVDVYSSETDRLVQTIAAPENSGLRNSVFSHDGKSLWLTDTLGRVFQVDRATERSIQSFPTIGTTITPPTVVPNGTFLAVSTSNVDPNQGLVCSGVWDTATGTEVFRLPDKVATSMFMPHRVNAFLDESTAVSTQQNTVARWNVRTGMEILPRFEEANGWIFYVAPAPDNRSLLLGLRDATVCIWDPVTNKVTGEFRGLRSTLTASTFSADGKALVTATHTGEVRLWDLPSGLLICELQGATGSISDIWFSKDERRLLAFVNEFSGRNPTGKSEVFVWDATGP